MMTLGSVWNNSGSYEMAATNSRYTYLLAKPLALSVSTAAPNKIVQMSQRDLARENLSPEYK